MASPPGLWEVCESGEGGGWRAGGRGAGSRFPRGRGNGGPGAAAGGGSVADGPCLVRGFRSPGTFHSPCLRWVGGCATPGGR